MGFVATRVTEGDGNEELDDWPFAKREEKRATRAASRRTDAGILERTRLS